MRCNFYIIYCRESWAKRAKENWKISRRLHKGVGALL